MARKNKDIVRWHQTPISGTGYVGNINAFGYEIHFATDNKEAFDIVKQACENAIAISAEKDEKEVTK